MKQKIKEAMDLAGRFKFFFKPPGKSFLMGSHMGSGEGQSLDYHDFRPYYPGDDLRKIDWNSYARTGQLSVSVYRKEIVPRIDIFLDDSASMGFQKDKRQFCLMLAYFFLNLFKNSGYSSRLFLGKQFLSKARKINEWDGEEFFSNKHWHREMGQYLKAFSSKRACLLIISDLLFQVNPKEFIFNLKTSASSMLVVQLNSFAEESPSLAGYFSLTDIESGEEKNVVINLEKIRNYRRKFMNLRESYFELCRGQEIPFFHVNSSSTLKEFCADVLIPAGLLRQL
ncbi:DUF58 domain-containing protein [Candidatus Riflebacteria bacterium]